MSDDDVCSDFGLTLTEEQVIDLTLRHRPAAPTAIPIRPATLTNKCIVLSSDDEEHAHTAAEPKRIRLQQYSYQQEVYSLEFDDDSGTVEYELPASQVSRTSSATTASTRKDSAAEIARKEAARQLKLQQRAQKEQEKLAKTQAKMAERQQRAAEILLAQKSNNNMSSMTELVVVLDESLWDASEDGIANIVGGLGCTVLRGSLGCPGLLWRRRLPADEVPADAHNRIPRFGTGQTLADSAMCDIGAVVLDGESLVHLVATDTLRSTLDAYRRRFSVPRLAVVAENVAGFLSSVVRAKVAVGGAVNAQSGLTHAAAVRSADRLRVDEALTSLQKEFGWAVIDSPSRTETVQRLREATLAVGCSPYTYDLWVGGC